MTIWKYPFAVHDVVEIEMPIRAKVLTVQVQAQVPCLWALVHESHDVEVRRFRIYGTGHPINHLIGSYVGTFQLVGGGLVFHVFEEA
jgi:hypothetical protein